MPFLNTIILRVTATKGKRTDKVYCELCHCKIESTTESWPQWKVRRHTPGRAKILKVWKSASWEERRCDNQSDDFASEFSGFDWHGVPCGYNFVTETVIKMQLWPRLWPNIKVFYYSRSLDIFEKRYRKTNHFLCKVLSTLHNTHYGANIRMECF